MTKTCWICGNSLKLRIRTDDLTVHACRGCGHQLAEHAPARAAGQDYHLSYDQDAFLQSLRATRERQARQIVTRLDSLGVTDRVLDYGCGRGFFLAVAQQMGFHQLAGADTSPLAVDWLRQAGLAALPIAPNRADLVPLVDAGLPFAPDAISFLDVVEHFPGDLFALFDPWLKQLPAAVRYLVIKVPINQGLLFRTSRVAQTLGLPGPLRQLYQVGSTPPHHQYFSRQSLAKFCAKLGLTVEAVWDDQDFEPASLSARVAVLRRLPAAPGRWAGVALAGAARLLQACDTRVVFARRQP